MESDRMGSNGCSGEPGRARLKAWRLISPNALSAHLFLGALSMHLRCLPVLTIADFDWGYRRRHVETACYAE